MFSTFYRRRGFFRPKQVGFPRRLQRSAIFLRVRGRGFFIFARGKKRHSHGQGLRFVFYRQVCYGGLWFLLRAPANVFCFLPGLFWGLVSSFVRFLVLVRGRRPFFRLFVRVFVSVGRVGL